MKKFLSILAAIGMSATAASAVVACGSSQKETLASNELSIQTTNDKTFGAGLTVDTITNLLKESTDSHTKDVANHVKSELGLTNWFENNEPAMITTYFGTTKPSFEDGSKQTDAKVNESSNTDANKASFASDAKDGKTLYVVLRNGDKVKDANGAEVTVAVLKLDFKAPVLASNELSIQTTNDKTFGVGLTHDTITNLLKESTDSHTKDVAKHVKSELELGDNWFENGNPIMITTYFGTTKPSFEDGSSQTDAKVNESSNTDANKASFPSDAKDGKTLYVVLRNGDKVKTANGAEVTVAVLKLDFKAPVASN